MRARFTNRVRQLARREEGLALVMALGMSVAIGATVTTTVAVTTHNQVASSHTTGEQLAVALAEAGLNNGLAELNNAADPKLSAALPAEAGPASKLYEGGTAQWYGKLEGSIWTVTGVGRVRSAGGAGGAEIIRRATARVRLGSVRRPAANNAIWNYLYADATDGCTSFQNSVVVDVPVYIRGNLCLQNSAQMTGFSLRVGGNVTIAQSATVGTAGSPIREAHIGGTCRLDAQPAHSPCSAADRIYASTITSQPTGLTKPAIDLAYWYENAMPGPRHGCTTGSFPGGFDNDAVMNRSRGTVDLTPSTAYDCTVKDSSGYVIGRIAWTPGTSGTAGKLIVSGTLFFDGDIAFAQQTNAEYDGRATIYSSGKITLSNQTWLCGAPGCATDWNPNRDLIAFVAGSSTDADSFTVGNFARFQGAVYAVNDFREGNNTTTWGPVIARQIYLQNSTIHEYVPIDALAPGMPATYEEVATLTIEPGSWES